MSASSAETIREVKEESPQTDSTRFDPSRKEETEQIALQENVENSQGVQEAQNDGN